MRIGLWRAGIPARHERTPVREPFAEEKEGVA